MAVLVCAYLGVLNAYWSRLPGGSMTWYQELHAVYMVPMSYDRQPYPAP